MIRIVVVEDETLVRQGMVELLGLNPEFAVVGEAATGEAALDVIAQARPDLVVMDIRMPGLNGPEVLRRMREQGLAMPVVLITTFDDDEAMVQGLRAGARGYLRKDISLAELTQAIHAVMAGQTVLRPAINPGGLERLRASAPKFDSATLPEPLSPRETEVLRLMAAGLSNREIAGTLGTSETTVKTQASTVLSKMGVRDRTRAVLKGLELGLI